MTVNKRKKSVRFRGSKTHGWGSMKKHRGAGNRGGRGMAGSGKRADTKKPTIIKLYGYQKYFGKRGFNRPQKVREELKIINVGDLNFEKKEVNLAELGYDKLLGKGKPDKAYAVTVKSCSNLAKEKIEKAGGSITNL
ncbi:MAG: uL15 family ribosomal protein [Candidatus Woesearchaeota archaeon]